jgi:hypothetical protein
MGQGGKVWPLLKHSPNPTLRSFLIDRLAAGGNAKLLWERFNEEPDVSIRRALLLSLGEFDLARLPQVERQNLLPRLLQIYQEDPDPGIHGAAEWLLRQWQFSKELAAAQLGPKPRWYVNRQGQTMVVVPKPGEFWVG